MPRERRARCTPWTQEPARVCAVVLMLLLPGLAHAAAVARRVALPGDVIPGPSAQGQVGDYLLENAFVRVLIDDIPHPHGFAETGGNVIDAAPVGADDHFASLFTMFDNTFGRQARYTSLTILDPGGGAATARLQARGTDSEDPTLAVTTDYALGPNDRFVQITTTVTNNGTAPVAQLQAGDAVQWGLTTHFAPGWANANRNIAGDGHDVGGKTLDVAWMGSDGLGSSYGYTAPSGTVEMSNGSTWSDGNVAYLDLAPGSGSASYTRYFIVGDGSLASISDTIFAVRGAATGTLQGRITESGTGTPIADASIVITRTQCLGTTGAVSYTIARTDALGNYVARLEPGSYRVLVDAAGRVGPSCATLAITAAGTTTYDATPTPRGVLSWTVRDGTGNPLPAKLSLLYAPLTARLEGPSLGDAHALVGGYAILSPTGTGQAFVPPGTYELWVTRGMEWTAHKEQINVTTAAPVQVSAVLTRVVDTTGYVSADMHVHAFNSADSGITFEIRAQQAAAEGLEIVVPTDHDFQSDMSGAIQTTGLGAWVATIPGNEITTNGWGHFNGYPMTVDTGRPRNGALDHTGLSPAAIFAGIRADAQAPVVQVNHPRAGGLGYFDLTALNPVTGRSLDSLYSADFDAVEVFNGKRLYQVPAVLNDWYHLLDVGDRLTGVGNTDTHQVFGQEIGYPRNFVRVGSDDPAGVSWGAFRDAIRAGHTLFTNGPFAELWVDGVPMGSDLAPASSTVSVHVKVQAAPWVATDTAAIVVNGVHAVTIPIPASTSVLRLDTTVPLCLDRDSWIALEVKGGSCETDASNNCVVTGCPGRLDPVEPPLYGTDPVCPYAHTNPVWVDVDRSGTFDAPGNDGVAIEPVAETRGVDSNGVSTRLGEVVTVRGTVTVGSYTFNHRSNNVYFQDASIDTTRVRSGGVTTYQSGLVHPELHPGDRIEATGTITQFNGLTELGSVSLSLLERDKPVPDPLPVTVAQLRSLANAEQWEGMLVRVASVSITSGTWPSFGNDASITVTDPSGPQTITLRVDGDTDVDGSVAPVSPFDLIAVVGQFDTSPPHTGFYQLLPRARVDLVEAADPNRILHAAAADPVTSCGAVVHWYTTKPGASRLEYGLTPSYGSSAADATPVTSHALATGTLQPGTLYHYRVVTDAIASPDATFTTPPASLPAITSGPVVNVVSATRAQVVWQTDAPASSEVEYGATTGYGSLATSALVTTLHVVDVTGLAPATQYHARVTSTATACTAGTTRSADVAFVTRPGVAGGLPGEVSGLTTGEQLYMAKSAPGSLVLEMQSRADASGANVYQGTLRQIWSHAASSANVCGATVTTPRPGRRLVTLADPPASSYFLVTAFNCTGEGPAGAGVPDADSTCAP